MSSPLSNNNSDNSNANLVTDQASSTTTQTSNSSTGSYSLTKNQTDNQQTDQTDNNTVTSSPITPPDGATPTSHRRKEVLASVIPEETEANPSPSQELEQAGPTTPEQEISAVELEPTIEKLEQEVERQKVKAPPNVAVRKEKSSDPTPNTVAQPVIVLPISEQNMKQGSKKSPTYSIKWLVTWAKRQVKKFKEILVVWRDTPYNQK